VWKVSVDGNFDCPNRDGTVGRGGCIYCDPASFSPSRRLAVGQVANLPDMPRQIGNLPHMSITEQLQDGIARLSARHRVDRFVAYFQPATNTYAPVEQLRVLYEEALAHPQVVGLVIGTRPDCVPDETLDLLAEFARRTWVSLELGLQTSHDRTLAWLNRGHHYQAFVGAVERGHRRGLDIGAHVILGLPGESRDDMQATARELARLKVHAVKLHNLYAVKGTPLADMVERGEVALPSLAEYAGWVVDFLEWLPSECVIDRLSGDAPRQYLVGPDWCLDKAAILAAIDAEFARRGTRQGAEATLPS
jgi:radical SAM protein (TIGR01212 family)